MTIIIKSLMSENPTKPYQVKVDRTSLLGNPYRMITEAERKVVCEKYAEYFYNTLLNDSKAVIELFRIRSIWHKYGRLELFCWCAPKQCHAETIGQWLRQHSNK